MTERIHRKADQVVQQTVEERFQKAYNDVEAAYYGELETDDEFTKELVNDVNDWILWLAGEEFDPVDWLWSTKTDSYGHVHIKPPINFKERGE